MVVVLTCAGPVVGAISRIPVAQLGWSFIACCDLAKNMVLLSFDF